MCDKHLKYKALYLDLQNKIIQMGGRARHHRGNSRHKSSNDIIKLNPKFIKRLRVESYDEYLQKRESIKQSRLKWIHDIVDGESEQDKIIHREDDLVLIPARGWNGESSRLHVLGIVTDKSIMTLRDLRSEHVPLLERIRDRGLELIESQYGVDKSLIRTYIHYYPSAWLLHVHFENISSITHSCAIENAHRLSSVITNLNISGTYYKDIDIEVTE